MRLFCSSRYIQFGRTTVYSIDINLTRYYSIFICSAYSLVSGPSDNIAKISSRSLCRKLGVQQCNLQSHWLIKPKVCCNISVFPELFCLPLGFCKLGSKSFSSVYSSQITHPQQPIRSHVLSVPWTIHNFLCFVISVAEISTEVSTQTVHLCHLS